MKEQTKLIRELKQYFPKADIRKEDVGDVSIIQDTFYSLGRHELARLEEKYKAGLWCDARNGKVFYYFHNLGEW